MRFDLTTAADLVGQSRKTLDDYLLQLRDAREFNFSFKDNRHEKIGLLRQFNKNHRKHKTSLKKRNKKDVDQQNDDGSEEKQHEDIVQPSQNKIKKI